MITALIAHPYPKFSLVSVPLVQGLRERFPDMKVRELYELYPDASIDVFEERRAVSESSLILFSHPVFWYSVPALLKQWFDDVLGYGFAYGRGGSALRGKGVLWLPVLGAGLDDEGPRSAEDIRIAEAPLRRMWETCGAKWLAPQVFDGRYPYSADEFGAQLDHIAQAMAAWESTHE